MINISNLSFGYKKKSELFSDLNIELEAGSIYGLLGKNGAGKTTLLKIISGLLFPQRGICNVLGYSPQKREPDFLNQIYYIPEEFYTPSLKIQKYIELLIPFYPEFDKTKFDLYLEELEIDTQKKFTQLSYGQKKRVYLAFGLASNCKILILDEPTNGLDIPTKRIFRKLLASSINEDNIIIISTHQVSDLQNIIDPVIILDNGKIVFHKTISDIAQKISIQLQQTKPADDEVLYYEKGAAGYTVLTENQFGQEDDINIELLFNAVISNSTKFTELVNAEVKNDEY
ncbi:MAG: ABC transporter ATP-binding protein [Melioribacteraceae bacterium]|nr:ABC transporter ATP-binding protein [Melioribacteraceae bacterium]